MPKLFDENGGGGSKVKNKNNVVSPITRTFSAEIQYFFEKEFVNRLLNKRIGIQLHGRT